MAPPKTQRFRAVPIYGGKETPDNSKLDLGTIKFESGTSGFPPEGLKKKSCVVFRDFWGGQKGQSKLAFGTIKFESGTSGFPPEGPKKKELCRKGHIQKNRKLDLGTIKFESGTSGFPPEGPKKRSCVERDTFKKIEN